jgi:hypothetical protein
LLLPDIDVPVKDNPTKDQLYPFLPYTAAYWPLHYVSQEATAASQSRKDARTLCNLAGHQVSIWVPSYFERRYLLWKGWTDLTLASYLGLKLIVEDILLEEKTDINMQGGYFGTALQAASVNGHEKVGELLLAKGADVNAQGRFFGSALQAASVGDHENSRRDSSSMPDLFVLRHIPKRKLCQWRGSLTEGRGEPILQLLSALLERAPTTSAKHMFRFSA